MNGFFINFKVLLLFVFFSQFAQGESFHFDASLLDGGEKNADLSLFDNGSQLPGNYNVDIIINNQKVDSRSVIFKLISTKKGKGKLEPCLTFKQLSHYGVNLSSFYKSESKLDKCFNLGALPGARAEFNFSAQTLVLIIPQKYMFKNETGIAPQTLWNDGITAFIMNYDVTTSSRKIRSSGDEMESAWIQLSPGLNVGAWRLRNTTVWDRTDGQVGKWQVDNTYIERGINRLKSRLTIGDNYTTSDIFDSVPLRGVFLLSDDNMVPPSKYTYAPVVRGIARTQARVEIKKNGITIYNKIVQPGPFEITNLNAGDVSGDLKVTVWETDGEPQFFTVPFESPAVAVNEGYLRYGIMGGKYRSISDGGDSQSVFEFSATYGLPLNITSYGGSQYSSHFRSAAIGVGTMLGNWGALSADFTESRYQLKDYSNEKGSSFKLRYSRQIQKTHTSLVLTSYQYNEDGYNSLSNVLDSWGDDLTQYDLRKKKSRSGVSVNQGLGEWGYFTISRYQDKYWGNNDNGSTMNMSYSKYFKNLTLSFNYSQTYTAEQKKDESIGIGMSLSLGRWLGGNNSASYRWSQSSYGDSVSTLGLTGSAFNRRVQWSASQQNRPSDSHNSNNGNFNITENGTYGIISGNYSYSPNVRQIGTELNGGMLIHRDGITLGQPLSNTIALVEAPGAYGVGLIGRPGVTTDFRGYTTSSDLMPYQENDISLDPTALPDNIDISQTDIKVVPTEGAVIPVKFKTSAGEKALIKLKQPNGKNVPFGSLVTNDDSTYSGIVSDNGQVYITGLKKINHFKVKWSRHVCNSTVILPENADLAGIFIASAVCS